MRKSLTYKVLAAVMALTAVNYALPVNTMAGYFDNDKNYFVESDGEIISSGTFTNVYGNGHSFTITGGTIDGDVFGVGNDNYDKAASGGNVTLSGGSVGNVHGGYSEIGSAYHNTVNISGDNSRVTIVYGGQSHSGKVYNNTVNISGGSVGNVHGGSSYSGTAHHNTVNISDGAVSGSVCGGYSEIGSAYHNTVNISGDNSRVT